LLQKLPCPLEALVFQQSFHQRRSGVRLGFLLLPSGQQHLGFDIHQLSGHGDKLAGHVHIQLPHPANMLQILLQNLSDGDIVDADFIF
jgi:hypothetical protein